MISPNPDRPKSGAATGPAAGPVQTPDATEKNVLGGPLSLCSSSPRTGFFRDGCCRTGPDDLGSHTVCAVVDERFLTYTLSRGNDLSTPRPEWGFPGLKPGDRWCLCASRWLEAHNAGVAPPIVLSATHERALDVVPIDVLRSASIEPDA